MKKIQGKGIVGGKAKGRAIVSERPFGFFGGVNPKTGSSNRQVARIIRRKHQRQGVYIP